MESIGSQFLKCRNRNTDGIFGTGVAGNEYWLLSLLCGHLPHVLAEPTGADTADTTEHSRKVRRIVETDGGGDIDNPCTVVFEEFLRLFKPHFVDHRSVSSA